MKNQISRGLRLALVMMPLGSCWADQAPPPPPVPDIAEAAAVPVAAERPAPANVRTDGPVGDLIKLANAGVDASVLLAFATSSGSLFNLNAEEIIYLKDLGVPSAVVTAILQHDQALKEQLANSNAPLPPPAAGQFFPQPAAPVEAAPAPAPQIALPDYAPPEDYYPAPPDMAEPAFYDSLSPYGNWIQVDGAGLCWQPSAAVVDLAWQPYFDGGHWLYTDCGWYWASDYSWGWAPFHYGRWFHHHRWGWCWAPDTVWGPSWVCWRYTDGYCGWAPLPPGAAYRPGFGLAFHGRRVGADFGFGLGADSFAFVSWAYFNERHLRPWGVRRERVERIYRQSTPVTRFQGDVRTVSNAGLSAEHVAAATHTPVRPVAIHGVNAPVAGGLRAEHLAPNGKTLTVFRPSPTDLSRPSAAISRRPETAAVRSPGATASPATARNLSNPAARSFGESRPVPLDPAGRNQALSNTRLSTAVRPAGPAPRTQPAWLVPQTQQTQRQDLPAQRENPRSFYQAPAQREYQVQTYQAPAQVPRYNSPAERSRLDSGPVYSAAPRALSAPAAAPAPSARPSPPPAAGSGPQPRSEQRGGR
ncbi:MAG TPA: DUF6600 domain-containing protein [Dongiaceae bacterium]|nr:DUF6600 domain-containing protein [Dongiaceae bacterium]